MTDPGSSTNDRAAADEEALYDQYLDECLSGEGVTPEAFLARHPHASDELRRRIGAIDTLRAVAAPTDEADAPLPYERLGGYRLVRRLGIGGMGSVYMAEQASLGRTVALKIVRSELRGSETLLKRFQREALVIARLRHPHIVNVYEFGRDQGAYFIAMELVRGRPLDEVLRDEPPPLDRVLQWCIQIARALAHAHEQAVVHRDVKPQNIMVTPKGRPVLLDFGVARLAESEFTRLTTQFAGSPTYAAPEQLRQGFDPVDGRTDVYALGVTLYEALTGRTPFGGGRLEEVLLRVMRDEPQPPRELNPAIAPDLETVVLKAMEKEPARRYQTAWAFADDLQRVVANRPIQARPPGPVRRVQKWTKRHPIAASIVGSVCAALLIASVVVMRSVAADRARANELVVEADGLVDELRTSRLALREREMDFENADRQRSAAYKTEEQDRHFDALLDEIEAHRRAREEKFYGVLERLGRAQRLHGGVEGITRVRARLFTERAEAARTARDPSVERYYRRLVERDDPDGRVALDRRDADLFRVRSDPPGADVYLFRFERQRQLREGGDRRQVPVPLLPRGQPLPQPLLDGTWALRVARGAGALSTGDLVLAIQGAPVRGTVFAADDGEHVQRGDRLLEIDGTPATSLWDVDPARLEGRKTFTFDRGGQRMTVPIEDLDVLLTDARGLGERGGARAQVWSVGQTKDVRLPTGLVLRPTAAPRYLVPACRVGTTPMTDGLRLPVGAYVAVLRLAGYEELVLPFVIAPAAGCRFDVDLLKEGTTPAGFVYVSGGHTVSTDDFKGWDFWIQERPTTRREYLQFLNDKPGWERAGAITTDTRYDDRGLPDFVSVQLRLGYFERAAGGRLELPSGRGGDLPASGLSWNAAAAYARWRGLVDNRTYTLPTWQESFRAQAGDTRMWAFGNAFRHKWVSCNLSRRGPTELEPAFRYPIDESPLGLYDAAGNVCEWLDKWWGDPKLGRKQYTGGSAAHADPRMFAIGQGNGARMHEALPFVGCRLVIRRARD